MHACLSSRGFRGRMATVETHGSEGGREGDMNSSLEQYRMASRLSGMGGLSLIVAGCSVALWTSVHPWGTVAGPEVGGSGQWALSHTFHFLGGLFASLGLLGLVHRLGAANRLERAGFYTAFVGAVMFTGTGVITAFLWPIFAEHAPALTELNGPLFSPPHPVIGITAVLFSAGFIMLWIGLARRGVLSRGVVGLGVAGAAMLIPPPPPLSPVPWIVFPIGGILFGIGLVALGQAMRTGRTAEFAVEG